VKTLRSLAAVQSAPLPVSIAGLAAPLGLPSPLSLAAFARRLSMRTFRATVTTPDPDSLGGQIELTIRGDGGCSLRIHMTNEVGLVDYSFRLGVFLRARNGTRGDARQSNLRRTAGRNED
jgi:hypothetical protein